jgi:hypothetical protein
MSTPRDDRGNPCELARLTNRQLAWRAIGIKSLTKDELIKQEQQVTLNTEIAVAIVGGLVGWVLWTAIFLPFTPLRGSLLGNFLIPTCASILASTVFWFGMLAKVRERKFSKIADIHLRHGRCAGCGYALQDLPTDEDGCIVCPECNAAWNAGRVSNIHD